MKKRILFVVYFVAALWAIELLDILLPVKMNHWGILPRTLTGLKGILLAPLLHANIRHLASNTLPLLILISTLVVFYKKQWLFIILSSTLIGGVLVWLFARSAYHIGASGLIYSIATFLIFNGILKKQFKELAIAILIILLYSQLIWGIFPSYSWISWEGHLFGALAGVLIAIKMNNEKKETPTKRTP